MGFIHQTIQEIGIAIRRGARRLPHAMTALVVPGDSKYPSGSRGDQAMLAALAKEMTNRHAGVTLQILTEGWEPGEEEVVAMGFKPVGAWRQDNDGPAMRRLLARTDTLLFLGADVMDGCYDEESSVKRWKLAETAQKMGARPVILGCSFNENPHPTVVETIRSLSLDFRVNLRDEASLARFQAVRPGKGKLVADIAFLIEAEQNCGKEVSRALAWVDGQRALGRGVFGVNINPHLFSTAKGTATLECLVKILAGLLEGHLKTRQSSVVLLPHDFRPYAKDNWCLDLVCARLTPEARQYILCVEEEPTAGELKRLVACVDFLITGRMHLAVAALGVAVPVGTIIYQGKFEGLMRHFGLDGSVMITPEQACQPPNLGNLLESISSRRDELNRRIASHLSGVQALAKANFD